MAFKLIKEKTQNTPEILIDEETRYIKIEGVCFLENIPVFFKETNDWLKEFFSAGGKWQCVDTGANDEALSDAERPILTFDCEISYFNSATAKQLYNMLLLMDKHSTAENKVVVNWYATDDDEISIEQGEDFKEEFTNLVFNMVER